MLVRYFRQVKNHVGVVGVIIINNMWMDRENIAGKLVHDGAAVQDALKLLDADMVRFIFQTLLNNVLICVRALKAARGADGPASDVGPV